MDWIENHGEAFLSKHTGVGKSLHRARALQKRHDDFEDVAQVSPGADLRVRFGFNSRTFSYGAEHLNVAVYLLDPT